MIACPVCGKILKTEFGLVGHLRLKCDNAHLQYNKRIIDNVKNEPVPQPQPTPDEHSTKDQLVGDVEQIVHHVIDGLVQPVKPEQPVVPPQPLLEQLKEKMDGWPVNDHAVIDGAPEDLQAALRKHHISLI
ncbi:unnamed protein product [marine sediment metagenome]|uniref:Uncharacterized protein n=1 Tax=marine sediment metagenome TaxID=412755 RepID=X1KVG3_9ZZZZ